MIQVFWKIKQKRTTQISRESACLMFDFNVNCVNFYLNDYKGERFYECKAKS